MPLEPSPPALELDPGTYARGHRIFEDCSDQRSRIVAWLADRLRLHGSAPGLSVLSVGCGDGSVDAALAEQVAGTGWSWTGVDPHGPGVAELLDRFEALPAPAPSARGQVCRFADLSGSETYDVITFVHSLYYVDDLGDTLRGAMARLTPGGEVLVLHAPLAALNRLTARFAPPVAGHPQPWSDEVERTLATLPVDVETTDLEATVDLSAIAEADPALLEFVVQAPLDDEHRAEAMAGLREIATDGPGLRVPHPVTAYRIRAR